MAQSEYSSEKRQRPTIEEDASIHLGVRVESITTVARLFVDEIEDS